MRTLVRLGLLFAMCGLGAWPASAADTAAPLRVGFLTDMSGPSAIDDGPGAITAARMAIADFGGSVLGRRIELLTADHQNKPDIGLSIAKKWYTEDGVAAIMDVNNSAVALGIQQLTRDQNRVFLITGASSSLLTGKACSPNSVQWATDTYSLARGVALPTLEDGGKSWYFLTVDYAFGHALERDASDVVKAHGGTVVGAAKHPYGTTDFSAFLVQAGASGAQVLAFADAGQDMENAVKQAREFGVKMRLTPLLMLIMDVHSVGLEQAQGALQRLVLLGPERQDPSLVEALLRGGAPYADGVAGRWLSRDVALSERDQGRRHDGRPGRRAADEAGPDQGRARRRRHDPGGRPRHP